MATIFVDLGPMSIVKKNIDEAYWELTRKLIRNTAEKIINATPGFTTKKPAKKATSFHLDGTLNSVTVTSDGRNTTVACHITLVVATFPEKKMFGFPSGSAKATGGSSASSVKDSVVACVESVMESLTQKAIKAMENYSP
jgi:hypothetical protein